MTSPAVRRKRSRFGGREGVSLVESAVAILVLGVWSAGMCKLAVMTREISDMARCHYTAINLAKNRLERAKAIDFDQIDGLEESYAVVNREGNPAVGGEYRRTTGVTVYSNDIAEVVVRVDVRDRISRTFRGRHEELRSYCVKFPEVEL